MASAGFLFACRELESEYCIEILWILKSVVRLRVVCDQGRKLPQSRRERGCVSKTTTRISLDLNKLTLSLVAVTQRAFAFRGIEELHNKPGSAIRLVLPIPSFLLLWAIEKACSAKG